MFDSFGSPEKRLRRIERRNRRARIEQFCKEHSLIKQYYRYERTLLLLDEPAWERADVTKLEAYLAQRARSEQGGIFDNCFSIALAAVRQRVAQGMLGTRAGRTALRAGQTTT